MNFTETEKQKIVSDMCRMIQCKTVSNLDDSLVEWSEFEKFRALLKEIFPKIYSACDFYKVGKTGIYELDNVVNVKNLVFPNGADSDTIIDFVY